MKPKKLKRNIDITNAAIGAIIVLISVFIIAHLSSSLPIFYVDNGCQQTLHKYFISEPSINLYNKGKEVGYAKFCISSNEFLFESENGGFSHNLCINEMSVSPNKTGLYRPIQIKIKPDANSFDDLEKASYTFEIKCRQKVGGILSKSCGSIIRTCKYNKDANSFNRVFK